jgi:hypothetical protein
LNGKHSGKKGIIIKSNYENTKERRYPHCLVVGLSKAPRRVTKASLKRRNDLLQKLESKGNCMERINKLKKLGVFVKTYNMTHLLATRYKVEDQFEIESSIKALDAMEEKIREQQTVVNKLEHEKKEKKDDKETLAAKTVLKEHTEKYKTLLREKKAVIGTNLFNRFNRGFLKSHNQEENENIVHSEFLFKQLKF